MHSFCLVNASVEIGTGHWLRCMELSSELRKLGIDSTFITYTEPNALMKRAKDNGVHIARIPKSDTLMQIRENAQPGDLVFIDDDCAEFKTLFFQRTLKELDVKSIYFTIDTTTEYIADFIISYNVLSHKLPYKISENTQRLTGLEYFIFREEFRTPITPKIKNFDHPTVLIMFGGSDPHQYTRKLILLLDQSSIPFNAIHVVQGSMADSSDLPTIKNWVQYHRNLSELRGLMEKTDIAFCGMGTSFYELALFKIPCWVSPLSTREIPSHNFIVKNKIAFNIDMDAPNVSQIERQFEELKNKDAMLLPIGSINSHGIYRLLSAILDK